MKLQLSVRAAVLLALISIGARAEDVRDLYAASAGACKTGAVIAIFRSPALAPLM